MGPKRKCVFNDKLKAEYKFLKGVESSAERVRCLTCNSEFSVEHKGRLDIEEHIKTDKHKRAVSAASSLNITSFFKGKTSSDSDLQCAAKEATFAYHTAQHELSFKTSDCTSKLIKKLFEPKFSAARTKTEAVIVNVISPYIFNVVLEDLNTVNFITITIDSSNRKDIKLTPIVVRYFTESRGVHVKLLYFDEVPGETSDILVEHILKCLKKFSIEHKIICVTADNTNTNFGGVNRKTEGNVYRKLQKALNRPIFGIGCGAHILHNAVQTACDSLPLDVEATVVKLYKYFYQYTVRVTQLKEFCEFADVEFKRLLSHGSTRFLSLMPALERILTQFLPLKLYFTSNENCPKLLADFFNDPVNELYILFVHGTLQMFQKTILKIEGNDINASEVFHAYSELISKLQERKNHTFLPFAAKQMLVKLKAEENLDEAMFKENISKFYDKCINYLNLWLSSFDKANIFAWANLGSDVTWDELEASGNCVNDVVPEAINLDDLFDERASLSEILKTLMPKWNTLPEDQKLTTVEKWQSVFNVMKKTNISYTNLAKVVEFAMCLPGSSAPAERVFSIMGNIWCAERGRLSISVVRELLNVKINSNMSCSDFYDKIKDNKQFLTKVISSEKYSTGNKSTDGDDQRLPGPSSSM